MTSARRVSVLVECTHEQHARLEALAATWGVSRPAALRRLLDEATTATTADVVTLLRAVLARVGGGNADGRAARAEAALVCHASPYGIHRCCHCDSEVEP